MSNEISKLLESNAPFINCFEFTLSNKEKLFLTSSNKMITMNNIDYLPYSGLNLDSFEFNDSAHNHVKISGIFENQAIGNLLDLDGCEVGVFFYFPKQNKIFEFITYDFGKIEYDGLKFIITLNSQIFKLHKSLLQNYSKNCRAVFGDSKCTVDIATYSSRYDIEHIKNSMLRISGKPQPDAFFTNGRAVLDDGSFYDIIDHKGCDITLSKALHCDIKKQMTVILTPGCDKNITTCCNKYSNAINFRGEPFMP